MTPAIAPFRQVLITAKAPYYIIVDPVPPFYRPLKLSPDKRLHYSYKEGFIIGR
jgi:hypothetical protein